MQESTTELYDGVSVKIGGKTYVIPPLSFGQIEKLAPVIDRMIKAQDEEKRLTPALMKDVSTVIHAALQRNYPSMTIQEVKDIVDTRNAMLIVAAIMNAAGFEEGNAAGETTPVV